MQYGGGIHALETSVAELASACPKHSMSVTDAAVAQATFSRRQAEAHWREVVAGEGNLVGIIPSASSPDPREAQGAVAA